MAHAVAPGAIADVIAYLASDAAAPEKAYPTLLAGVREHVMNHLADLDLAAFTHAMSGIAAPEMGPPVRRTPNLASLTNGRQRETTTGPQGAG